MSITLPVNVTAILLLGVMAALIGSTLPLRQGSGPMDRLLLGAARAFVGAFLAIGIWVATHVAGTMLEPRHAWQSPTVRFVPQLAPATSPRENDGIRI